MAAHRNGAGHVGAIVRATGAEIHQKEIVLLDRVFRGRIVKRGPWTPLAMIVEKAKP
jgi:hypothetical protein